MTRLQKIYRITAVAILVLHCLLFGFILYCNTLPFREDSNYYQVFFGFFGNTLDAVQPYLILLLPLAAAVFTGVFIRKPIASLGISACILLYAVIIAMPASIDATVGGLAYLGGLEMEITYQQGYYFLAKLLYIIYLEFAFTIFAVVVAFKSVADTRQKKAQM